MSYFKSTQMVKTTIIKKTIYVLKRNMLLFFIYVLLQYKNNPKVIKELFKFGKVFF